MILSAGDSIMAINIISSQAVFCLAADKKYLIPAPARVRAEGRESGDVRRSGHGPDPGLKGCTGGAIMSGWTAAALIIFLAAWAVVSAVRNMAAMNQVFEAVMEEIRVCYPVAPVDPGRYSLIRVRGIMKFHVQQYRIEGVGNLSAMKVNVGLMQMLSVIVTPLEKDVPLTSLDYIYLLGRRKTYLEYFDLSAGHKEPTVLCRQKMAALSKDFGDLRDHEIKPSWQDSLLLGFLHKQGVAADDARLFDMQKEGLEAMLELCAEAPALTGGQSAARRQDVAAYYNSLLSRGGAAADVFRASLGEETTRDLFARVLFGTEAGSNP